MISDPEVKQLAAIASLLAADYTKDELEWANSPFGWIRTRPSRQVGTIGEKLVAGWLATKDFDVGKSPDSEADRLINGHRIEIKFSSLWKTGVYKFQQLRDQNYEYAICLGVSPFDASCWILPKAEIMRRWELRDGIESQHGGSRGADTAWLSVDAKSPPDWLGEYGGALGAASEAITAFIGRD